MGTFLPIMEAGNGVQAPALIPAHTFGYSIPTRRARRFVGMLLVARESRIPTLLQVDPTGDFIRHWVPELRSVRGPGEFFIVLQPSPLQFGTLVDLHNPSVKLADKLGYPRPIISHKEARERALRRYQNPGEE